MTAEERYKTLLNGVSNSGVDFEDLRYELERVEQLYRSGTLLNGYTTTLQQVAGYIPRLRLPTAEERYNILKQGILNAKYDLENLSYYLQCLEVLYGSGQLKEHYTLEKPLNLFEKEAPQIEHWMNEEIIP